MPLHTPTTAPARKTEKADPMRNRPAPSLNSLIDRGHLERYTMGDEALMRELLTLFCEQMDKTLGGLRAARTADEWHFAAHTLKGSARAVGAVDIARLAQELERDHMAGQARLGELEELARTFCAALRGQAR